jgi:hypothetical protein
MGRTGAEELIEFRLGLYGAFTAWGDALFELTDALSCSVGPVHSVPSLSLEPEFQRSHGSLLQVAREGPGRRGGAAQAARRARSRGVAISLRGRRLHLGAL